MKRMGLLVLLFSLFIYISLWLVWKHRLGHTYCNKSCIRSTFSLSAFEAVVPEEEIARFGATVVGK